MSSGISGFIRDKVTDALEVDDQEHGQSRKVGVFEVLLSFEELLLEFCEFIFVTVSLFDFDLFILDFVLDFLQIHKFTKPPLVVVHQGHLMHRMHFLNESFDFIDVYIMPVNSAEHQNVLLRVNLVC